MAEIQGQVLSVQSRPTSKNPVYEVAFSDGQTYSTFEKPLADEAQALVGQAAVADISVKQKGQYTNYYLNSIRAAQAVPAAAPAVAAAPIPVAAVGGMSPEREQKIVKQSSFATAFNFVGSLYQGAGPDEMANAVKHAHLLAKDLFGHVFGQVKPVEEPPKDSVPW